ncbi:methyl transferase [Heterostelium album PN500]|uniref:Methyl transferase n=1 Tax=Heterostelium pallidum (strain ATCC 26659 / Pp 5 / PN500) TaxID=670386 RepID=D3B0G1_HETP5|nr:methyl transferase [Heterostelium album PN500]EFA84785.1 methyl transferase [Heterostelium album PN500]|eukprot:XP_020436897.1 methyl transferase [Heterostelium album PN500]
MFSYRTSTMDTSFTESQNIYDNPEFFERYNTTFDREYKEEEIQTWDAGALDWPKLKQMLPKSINGMDVADLGCGFGYFSRWAHKNGAKSVVGYDLSENMLQNARKLTGAGCPSIKFIKEDMENIELRDTYDLIFSSLAIHYVSDIGKLFGKLGRAVRPGGYLVFSVEHPIMTAPLEPQTDPNQYHIDNYFTEANPQDRIDFHRPRFLYLSFTNQRGVLFLHQASLITLHKSSSIKQGFHRAEGDQYF